MIRKLCTAAAALLAVAALGMTTAGTAEAKSVIPHRGHYVGSDHQGNAVSFSFVSGSSEVTHFVVGGQSFGNAHVSSSAWHERCNGGWCFKGHWQTSTYAVGEWRHGGSHVWHPWSAFVSVPHRGRYLGSDHGGAEIRVSFNGSHIHGFTVNGYGTFPSVAPVGGQWHETCSQHWCYKGHYTDDNTLVGAWRTPGSTWHAWEARAISS